MGPADTLLPRTIGLADAIQNPFFSSMLNSLTNEPPKSLMCMFGPFGNFHARNLFEVVSCIQQHTGVQFKVNTVR